MKIKEYIKKIKFKTAQIYIAIKSPKTPWYSKAMGWITIAYALSPIDLIPDFIPVLGYIDDLIILPIFVWITIKLIPKELWLSFEEEAKTVWINGKPIKWYYAIPIIILWLIVIYIILKAIFN